MRGVPDIGTAVVRVRIDIAAAVGKKEWMQ